MLFAQWKFLTISPPEAVTIVAEIRVQYIIQEVTMGETRQRALQAIILKLLPEDCSFIGNKSLLQLACNVDGADTAKGELVSGGKGKIAAWPLDSDYDGRSLFPHQVFFPMAGKDGGWLKLKKNIRAELDEDLLAHFVDTVLLPFEAGANHTVAVKIVDDRGIESLKVMKLMPLGVPA